MPNPATETAQPKLDFMVDKIKQEQCVLVLGPEVNVIEDLGKTHRAALLEQLNVRNNENIYRYYPDDDFFLFDEAYKRPLICHQIKSFYQQSRPNKLHRLLAEIPFHIYLTVTPDSLLHRAYDQADFSYQSGYYKRNKDPHLIKTPSRKNPLIYNLFGSVESEESSILMHDDLYDYFKSIFAQRSMPEKLKIELQEGKNQLERVRQLIREAEMEEAIDLLSDLVEDTELEDDIMQLAGRYRKYKKRVIKGVLSQENQQVTENQITEALMELIDEAKKLNV